MKTDNKLPMARPNSGDDDLSAEFEMLARASDEDLAKFEADLSDPNVFACVVCGARLHYIDTMVVNNERVCLACMRKMAERGQSEIARLASELEQARATSSWLWRCLREMRRVRNFYLNHVAETTKYFRSKGHLMLGFCESVDEILFHEHYSRYEQRQD